MFARVFFEGAKLAEDFSSVESVKVNLETKEIVVEKKTGDEVRFDAEELEEEQRAVEVKEGYG